MVCVSVEQSTEWVSLYTQLIICRELFRLIDLSFTDVNIIESRF